MEKAVDLAAMLLGYRDMFVNYSIVEHTKAEAGFIPALLRLIGQDHTEVVIISYGYLTQGERQYARRVMESL